MKKAAPFVRKKKRYILTDGRLYLKVDLLCSQLKYLYYVGPGRDGAAVLDSRKAKKYAAKYSFLKLIEFDGWLEEIKKEEGKSLLNKPTSDKSLNL